MRTGFWIFFLLGLFFVPVVIVYASMGGEPVGVGALTLSALMNFMVAFYLMATNRKSDGLPEDDVEAVVADHDGVYGEFSPYSWWPLPLAAGAGLIFLALAVGWWIGFFGAVLGGIALIGWVFEAYRGKYAH